MVASGIAGLEAEAWLALVAPAGTPKEVIARLNAETQKILSDPAIKERLEGLGFEAAYTTPEGLAALMKKEREVWGKVIKATGARVE
jgi:tripartite-type tricarboxylate transporter receptor subunit TctC